jgi:hypothetical protein
MDFGEYNIHEFLWEGVLSQIIREYVIVFQDPSLDLLGRFLTFCSRESTSCINEIKDIILHIDDREWLNKNFWFFDDSTPEETGYLFGEVAVVSNSEYRTHAFYQLASKKIVLLIPNDKSLKPIFFSIFEFLEILEWWKNIITKIEEGEIKVDLISQLKNKSI